MNEAWCAAPGATAGRQAGRQAGGQAATVRGWGQRCRSHGAEASRAGPTPNLWKGPQAHLNSAATATGPMTAEKKDILLYCTQGNRVDMFGKGWVRGQAV